MNKNNLSISIIFFGVCIVVGLWFISNALKDIAFNHSPDTVTVTQPQEYNYELIALNENNLILFDKQTGTYWSKSIDSTEWKMQPNPWE